MSERDQLAYPLARAEEFAHFVNHPAEALCGVKVVEAQGIHPAGESDCGT